MMREAKNAPGSGENGQLKKAAPPWPWFWCHRRDRWPDAWTYGDWRQWVCKRGTGTQCARISALPEVVAVVAAIFAAPMALLEVFLAGSSFIIWGRVHGILALGLLILAAWAAYRGSGWRLMFAVAPMNRGTRRVLPGEADGWEA